MAVATDTPTHVSLGAGTTTTVSFACGASKSGLIVTVGHWDGTDTSASVTFGGTTVPKIAERAAIAPWDRVEIFELTSPTNTTANIVITHPTASSGGADVFTTTGQDTTTPVGTAVSARNTAGAASISVSGLTVNTGDLVVAAVVWDSSAAGNPTGSAQSPATAINFSNNTNTEGNGSLSTTSTSIQANFTNANAPSALVAIPLRTAAGAAVIPPAGPWPRLMPLLAGPI